MALPFLRVSSMGPSYLASHLTPYAKVYSPCIEDFNVKNETTEGKTKIQQVPEKKKTVRKKQTRLSVEVRNHKAVVLNQGRFYSPGNILQCLETFLVCLKVGCSGMIRALSGWRARDVVKHPAMPWMAPNTKNDPSPNVSGVEAEKPCHSVKYFLTCFRLKASIFCIGNLA